MASYSLCGTSVENTGEQACDKSRGVLNRPLIFNGAIASSDYATEDLFFSKLVSNAKLSKNAANKVFPLKEVQDIVNNSEANTEGTLGLGLKVILREGKPVYTIKFKAGSDLLKRLRKFNNQTIRIIEFDSNGVFWGTKKGTDFVGFQASLFFTGNFMANGTEVSEGIVTCTISVLSTSEYIDNAYWMESTGNIDDIAPMIDVKLVRLSNSSNVFKYQPLIYGSNLKGPYNTWDEIGAALAALTFTATANGSALTITSVAADNALDALTVTYDSTAYTALSAGAKIVLVPPSLAALDAGDVTNTELLASEPFTK